MTDVYDILIKLKEDFETEIPALLASAGLEDFDVYSIGGSRNAKQKGFFIYQDEQNFSYSENRLSIIFQAQLYSVNELTAAKYGDVIFQYLKKYSPSNIGMLSIENINIDTWPIEQNSTTFIYFTITYIENLDSCDLDDEDYT